MARQCLCDAHAQHVSGNTSFISHVCDESHLEFKSSRMARESPYRGIGRSKAMHKYGFRSRA